MVSFCIFFIIFYGFYLHFCLAKCPQFSQKRKHLPSYQNMEMEIKAYRRIKYLNYTNDIREN